MSDAEPFFDTNVLLYLLSGDTAKADRAEGLVAQGGVISVQVLNEFAAVARRKNALSWAEIGETLSVVRAVCRVAPLTTQTHDRALAIAERHESSFYDALIWAAAGDAGCGVLYSEDMQDGQMIDRTTLRNPFV